MSLKYFYFFTICLVLLHTFDNTTASNSKDESDKNKKFIKKDPRDYTDQDVDKLFEQWEDNDEDILPEDERHDYFLLGKNRPNIRPEDFTGKSHDDILKLSKKGQTLMMFATVSGSPTRRETEEITQIWWASLKNALLDVKRYVISDDRILLLLSDGSDAFAVRDFLVQQDRCLEVTIDNRPYYGKGATEADKKKKQDL